MGMGSQHHASAALPPGKTWYPLYRRLGGPQGRSEWVRKISPPPGFDPRTVQPVASRYTDWAIPAPIILYYIYSLYIPLGLLLIHCDSFYHSFQLYKKSHTITTVLYHYTRQLEVSHTSEVYTGSIPEASFCDSPLNSSCRPRCIRKRSETCHMLHRNCRQDNVNRVYLVVRIAWTRLKLLVNRRLTSFLVFVSLAAIDRQQLTESVVVSAYWLDSTETEL